MDFLSFIYLILVGMGLGGNILCALFIVSPLAKNFLQRKKIFLASILPIVTGLLSASIFFRQGGFRYIIVIIYSITALLFVYVMVSFIRNHANWKHYIYLVILLLSIAWSFIFNWDMTGGCIPGICVFQFIGL